MRLLHPSVRRLRHWLDHGEPHDVDRHVVDCSRCATRLEELATPLPDITTALSQSLQPPDDLVHRLGVRMTQSMRNREDMTMLLELMGVPWHTVQTLMSEQEDDS